MADESGNNRASLPQPLDDASNYHQNPISMTCITPWYHTQTQDPHSMLQATVTGKNFQNKKKNILTRGHVVNLYRVWQKHGEVFELEGELVLSAVIMTVRSVVAVTGVYCKYLISAKPHTNIEWDVWRIRYLGKAHSGDVMNQDSIVRSNTILAKSNPTSGGYKEACQGYKLSSSHESSVHIYKFHQVNQYGACEPSNKSACMNLMAPEPSTLSVQPTDLATSTQLSPSDGIIGNLKATMLHTKTQRIPAAVRTTPQRRRYQDSDTTRAKKSMHSGNAKLYRIEQVHGSFFEYEGRSVDFAIIRALSATARFLNCPIPTVHGAVKAKSRGRKGIIRKVWIVKQLKNGSNSA